MSWMQSLFAQQRHVWRRRAYDAPRLHNNESGAVPTPAPTLHLATAGFAPDSAPPQMPPQLPPSQRALVAKLGQA
eukprot:scaffold3344_cov35-Tisochrysis_lutea.AAC.1